MDPLTAALANEARKRIPWRAIALAVAAVVAVLALMLSQILAGGAAQQAVIEQATVTCGRQAVVDRSAQVKVPDVVGITAATLAPEQVANAATIVAVGQRVGAPPRGILIALMTAGRESGYTNLPGGDGSSVGLFQQTTLWGSYAERHDPVTASEMFYTGGRGGQPGLLDIVGWPTMTELAASDAVQHSAYPFGPAAWLPLARELLAKLAGVGQAVVDATTAATAAAAQLPCTTQRADVVPAGAVDRAGRGHIATANVTCNVGGPGRVERAPGNVPIKVCTVDGIDVNTSLATDTARMFTDAKRDGLILGGSGWRSNARQKQLYAQNCTRGGCSPPTAVPGTSEHEWGLALDLTCGGVLIASHTDPCFVWLAAHHHDYGVKNLSSEPWHWSFDGT